MYAAIRAPHDCLGHQITTDASIGYRAGPAGRHRIWTSCSRTPTWRCMTPRRTAAAPIVSRARHGCAGQSASPVRAGFASRHHGGRIRGSLPAYRRSQETTPWPVAEALLRWRHPDRGLIAPAEFIPIAEDAGLINELGDWVLHTACAEAARWPDNITLASTFAGPAEKSDHGAQGHWRAGGDRPCAEPAGDRNHRSVLIRDDDTALAILHSFATSECGSRSTTSDRLLVICRICSAFPSTRSKIDRCFVTDIAETGGSSSIVEAVVNIATARHMTTTAEGVETEQQKELLRALGLHPHRRAICSARRGRPPKSDNS